MRESVFSEGMSVTVCMLSQNIHLTWRNLNCKIMQAKFPKLNENFRETKPLSKVFNSGLSSWRPLKSEKGSTLSGTPHLPGWVSAYSVSASWTPSEESTASQKVPCLIIHLYHTGSSLYADSLTASLWLIKYHFTKHVFCLSLFVPSKNQWLLSPLCTSNQILLYWRWLSSAINCR